MISCSNDCLCLLWFSEAEMVTNRYDASAASVDEVETHPTKGSDSFWDTSFELHAFILRKREDADQRKRFEIDDDIIDACEAATAVLKKK